MNFNIPCSTFARLINAAIIPEGEERTYLHGVYLHRTAGKLYAIATNAQVMAIELLDEDLPPEDEGAVFVMGSPALIEQCHKETMFNSVLTVTLIDIPGMQTVTATTTYGYTHPVSVGYFGEGLKEISVWKTYIVPEDVPKKSHGFMFFDTEQISNLGKASPSGRLVFPEHIDNRKPVIVNDSVDPSFAGLFLPHTGKNSKNIKLKPAVRPDWI